MIYDDDEQIRGSGALDDTESKLHWGKVEARIINKSEAPMDETPFKVLLELKGVGSHEGRLGLDLVTVLDISGSMGGKKLARLKLAMQFLLQKLGRCDRLSVVTFNSKAQRLCPLRQMTENSRMEIENLVNVIEARGSTNTAAGLQLAVEVLNSRSRTRQRQVAIMLVSDGCENGDSDAASVPVGNVPVYTFGFGDEHDPEVLGVIAAKSNGGMFSAVYDLDNLGIAFSQCLAGLLNTAVQNLSLTITPLESTFKEVNAGNYPKSSDGHVDSVTVSFGNLYDMETRKVLVELLLPSVSLQCCRDVLEIFYEYRVGEGNSPMTDRRRINVTRRNKIGKYAESEKEEVVIDEKRLRTVYMMKEARILADARKFEMARDKLIDAKESLLDEVDGMLRTELDQLILLMSSMETYDKKGRSFALSSETSHGRQRFAARGDVKKLRVFNTPLMDLYLQQAMAFDEDPTMPVPTMEDDMKAVSVDKDPMENVDVNNDIIGINHPFGSIFGSLMYYIYIIVQFVKSLINRFK